MKVFLIVIVTSLAGQPDLKRTEMPSLDVCWKVAHSLVKKAQTDPAIKNNATSFVAGCMTEWSTPS